MHVEIVHGRTVSRLHQRRDIGIGSDDFRVILWPELLQSKR